MEIFFPEQGYCHAGTPDFEAYSEQIYLPSRFAMALLIKKSILFIWC
nr:hypothetical protein [uncultured Treponema sp.]